MQAAGGPGVLWVPVVQGVLPKTPIASSRFDELITDDKFCEISDEGSWWCGIVRISSKFAPSRYGPPPEIVADDWFYEV